MIFYYAFKNLKLNMRGKTLRKKENNKEMEINFKLRWSASRKNLP